ncbi:PepSY domain-containing protein [Fulvimonas soli]|jgi:hypothetical protein|uniref:YpeB-like protein with putative protease inhibitory function n=1 Tax=Fulvimonas soli TaxID=155197 RepID=A0A316I870_9GAMM|nr:PepSY domain-containing protein [Fulvimonas soli]PWK89668.1 YpeB-like protein with putative protease inhibitory function [Fulvimonas soli]TNY27679.1 peptidase M4 [Fulvimonas soli]
MKKLAPFALALALGATGAVTAQDALTEHEVRAQLERQGYTKVHDLKFSDGMWRAHAKSGDGNRVTVRVDPTTGQAFADEAVSRLSERDVRAALSTQGYTDVHDVDFEDGLWRAKAENGAGKHVRLEVDPESGRVVASD